MDNHSGRQHFQRHAVASLKKPRVQKRLVNHSQIGLFHLLQEVLGQPRAERLDEVAGTQTGACQDVRQVARFIVLQQCNVAGSVGVVFYAENLLAPGHEPVVIYKTHAPLVATTSAAYGDFSGGVTSTGLLFGNSQFTYRAALPQVLVNGFFEMCGARLQVTVGVELHFDVADR